jgi:hypothetical protein
MRHDLPSHQLHTSSFRPLITFTFPYLSSSGMLHSMAWDLTDAESFAALVYGRARADQDDPPGVRTLAKRLGIRIVIDHRPWPGMAALGEEYGAPIIYLRGNLPLPKRCFAIAHELAEWILAEEQVQGELIENLADAVAAAIVSPASFFRRLVHRIGEHNLADIANVLHADQTFAALRLGEVFQVPLALVAPHRIWKRGPKDFVWLTDRELVHLARATSDFQLTCEFESVRLSDEPKRVLIKALA